MDTATILGLAFMYIICNTFIQLGVIIVLGYCVMGFLKIEEEHEMVVRRRTPRERRTYPHDTDKTLSARIKKTKTSRRKKDARRNQIL